MISIIIAFILISDAVRRYMKYDKNLTSIILCSLVLPYLKVGEAKIDCLYFASIIFVMVIFIKNKGSVIIEGSVWAKKYYLLNISLIMLYSFAWLLNSRKDASVMIAFLFGLIKSVSIVFCAYVMNRNITKDSINKSLINAMETLMTINSLVCVIQLNSVQIGSYIVGLLGSEETISYLEAITKYGYFTRCFGIMDTPMGLGLVSLFSAAFFLIVPKKISIRNYLFLVASVYCGVCSASKIFWLGMCILIVMVFFKEKRNVRGYIVRLLVLIVIVLVFVCYDKIDGIIRTSLGSTYAYYWQYLKKPFEVFATRYSNESVFLGFMPSFMKKYWLIGVGPSSIMGERAIDSAFVNILHDGGIIGLLIVVAFYLRLFQFNRKNNVIVIMLVLLFCTGFGFQTWIASRTAMFVIIYILMITDNEAKYKMNSNKSRTI